MNESFSFPSCAGAQCFAQHSVFVPVELSAALSLIVLTGTMAIFLMTAGSVTVQYKHETHNTLCHGKDSCTQFEFLTSSPKNTSSQNILCWSEIRDGLHVRGHAACSSTPLANRLTSGVGAESLTCSASHSSAKLNAARSNTSWIWHSSC